MKLLKELVTYDVKLITESSESGNAKKYFLEGIFLQGGIPNKNNRVYPGEILSKEVQRYNEQYVAHNRAYGELGHPDVPTINLERVSHLIRSLKPEGKNYIGRAEILETPNGKIVRTLMEAGATLAVSSRGLGSLKQENNHNIVQDDFMLMTAADIVADPSAPDAFVTSVMEEREWVYDNGIIKPAVIEGYKKRLKKSKNTQEDCIKIFEDFLSRL